MAKALLTSEQRDDLGKLEKVVLDGIKSFVAVGNALMEIHDRKLYREVCSTFEAYVQIRFGWSRAHAYRHIEAAKTVGLLSPGGDIAPTSERVLRPLGDVPDEQVAEVWHEAVEVAGGKQPTEKQVAASAAPKSAAAKARREERKREKAAAKLAAAPAAEPETPESSSGSTDSSSPGGVSEVGIDRPVSGFDPRDQTEPDDTIEAPEANPSATTPSTGASDSHRVDAARDGEPAPDPSPVGTPLSVVDGGLAEVRTVLSLSMRQLTKVELLAITDDEETRLTAIGRYCQQIVTRRRLVCEEAAKEAAKGAAA